MNRVEFIYCCLYKWSEKVNGRIYPNRYSASIMMAFILMLVFSAPLSIIIVSSGINVLSIPYGKVVAALFPIFLFIMVHLYFSYEGRWLKRINEFEKSTSRFRSRPGIVVWSALGVAMTLLFTVWFVIFSRVVN